MDTSNPLISIVTTVYNGADYLPDLIESVLAQDYPHYEHIVVEGGSTDDGATVAVLERYPHLRWWVMAGSTAYEAQKAGMATASGDFICLVNADDRLVTPDALSSVVAYWRQHPDCDLIYGWTQRMDAEGNIFPTTDFRAPPSLWLMRHIAYVQHCALYVSRRLVIDQKIELDTSLLLAADWDWMIRLFAASERIGYLRRPLAVFRLHLGQRSRTAKWDQWVLEYKTICQRHGSSYRLRMLLRRLLIWRQMVVIAVHTLVKRGPVALLRVVGEWIGRRVRGLRSTAAG